MFLIVILLPGEEKIFFHRVQIARYQVYIYCGLI
jgi:hypothetical protein